MTPYRPLIALALMAAAAGCGAPPLAATDGASAPASPRFPGPCTVEVDQGGDGTVDERRLYSYSPGAVRRLASLETQDAHGTRIAFTTHRYDDLGRMVELNDGKSITTFTRDAAGNLVQVEVRDATTRQLKRTTESKFDSNNRALEENIGDVNLRFFYDAEGRLVRTETRQRGELVAIEHRLFETGAQVRTVQVDLGGDGSIEAKTLYLVDVNGRVATTITESVWDGRKTETHNTYDAGGNVVATVTTGSDPSKTRHDYACWAATEPPPAPAPPG